MPESARIVIAGGGYGGVRAALKLRSLPGGNNLQITVVDRNDYHMLSQLLHEAATERVSFDEIFIPFRDIFDPGITFMQATITGLDRGKRQLLTDKGNLPYDYLIIALGGDADFFDIPGLEENSFTLKTLQDARNINRHIHRCFQNASQLRSSRERAPWLTFVIGGGGFAGTQMSGEMSEWLPRLADLYGVPRQEIWLVLIEATPHILRGFDPILVKQGQAILQKKGVDVLTAVPVASRDAEKVLLKDGRSIPTKTLIWTGGVRGSVGLKLLGLPVGPRHRVPVDEYLRLEDDQRVFIVGDSALIRDDQGNPLPPSAQYALQQADLAAVNIKASITGKSLRRYEPKIRGLAISIGRTEALASAGQYRFTGLNAVFFKQMIVLKYIFSLRNLNLIFHRAATPVRALKAKPVHRMSFNQGERTPLPKTARFMEFGDMGPEPIRGKDSLIPPRRAFRLIKRKNKG